MPKKISIEDFKKELEEAGIQDDTSFLGKEAKIYKSGDTTTGPIHLLMTKIGPHTNVVQVLEQEIPTTLSDDEMDEVHALFLRMAERELSKELFTENFFNVNIIRNRVKNYGQITMKHMYQNSRRFIVLIPNKDTKFFLKAYLSHINIHTPTWTCRSTFSSDDAKSILGLSLRESVPHTVQLSQQKVTTVQNDASSFPRLSELLKNEPDTAMRKMYIPDEDREKILTSLNDSRSSTSTEVPETKEPEAKEPETTEVEVPEPEDASGTEVQIMELTIDQKVVPMYLRKDNMLLDYITKTIVGRISTNTNLAKKGTVSVDWVQGFPENLSVYTKYKDQSYFHAQ
jgi:hypothetical protein